MNAHQRRVARREYARELAEVGLRPLRCEAVGCSTLGGARDDDQDAGWRCDLHDGIGRRPTSRRDVARLRARRATQFLAVLLETIEDQRVRAEHRAKQRSELTSNACKLESEP